MAPLIVLIVVTLLARLAGRFGVRSLRDWAAATRVGLAVMFCFTAAAHFNNMRADMIRMMPPSVPYPELMVTFTGICSAATPLVPRIALQVLFIALFWWSGVRAGREPN